MCEDEKGHAEKEEVEGLTERACRIYYLKIEEQGDKQGKLSVNGWLVGTLVWPCSAPDQHSLSYFHIKFLSDSFLGDSSPFSTACVHTCVCTWRGGGVERNNGGPTSGQRIRVSVVPATGVSAGVRVSVISSNDQAAQNSEQAKCPGTRALSGRLGSRGTYWAD